MSNKKNKHSPAPWRYNQKFAGEYRVLDKKGTIIASTFFFPQFDKEAKSNAALMSYAPEMYDLLQRIQNQYFDYSNTTAPRYRIQNEVKDLLKKIEDEQ
jgi:peptidoglycan hydrolase CwlO-like protein